MSTTDNAKTPAHNPFDKLGKKKKKRSAVEILGSDFRISIGPVDRGTKEYDPDRINPKTGVREPGYVKVPKITHEPVIEFTVNEGKGTGRQTIPASEFPEYVASLEEIIDSGFEEPISADETKYVPTYEIAKESFRLVHPKKTLIVKGVEKSVPDETADRDIVSVRATGGKGAKPMTVHRSEFPEVVEMLRTVADSISEHSARAWEEYEAAGGSITPPTETDGSDDSDDEDSDE